MIFSRGRTNESKNQNVFSLVTELMQVGDYHESRIGATYESIGHTVAVDQLFVPYRRGMVRRLGVVEALQFLSGYFDERHINAVVPSLKYHYGGVANAYGIKVANQLEKVINQLIDYPETRRAVLHIGKPEDGQETTKPCMQEIQFQIREDRLHTTIFARSWDAINGLPYDLTMFNLVSQVLANYLVIDPGVTTAFASSLHFYTKDLQALIDKYGEDELKSGDNNPPWYGIVVTRGFDDMKEIREWAIDSLNTIDSWEHGLPEGMETIK